jgi:hypothetical protein
MHGKDSSVKSFKALRRRVYQRRATIDRAGEAAARATLAGAVHVWAADKICVYESQPPAAVSPVRAK